MSELDEQIDEILFRMWGGGIDYALSPDFNELSDDEKDALYERYKTNLAELSKSELLQLVLEVIGDDEPVDTEYFYYNQLHGHRNGLRAEQRKRAKELFGDIK